MPATRRSSSLAAGAKSKRATGLPTKVQALIEELDVEVESRCSQLRSVFDQQQAAMRVHFRMQLEKLPRSVRGMSVREFMAAHGHDCEQMVPGDLSKALSAFPVDPIQPPKTVVKTARRGVATASRTGARATTAKKTGVATRRRTPVDSSTPTRANMENSSPPGTRTRRMTRSQLSAMKDSSCSGRVAKTPAKTASKQHSSTSEGKENDGIATLRLAVNGKEEVELPEVLDKAKTMSAAEKKNMSTKLLELQSQMDMLLQAIND